MTEGSIKRSQKPQNEIYTIGNAVAPLVHVYIAVGSKIGLKFDLPASLLPPTGRQILMSF